MSRHSTTHGARQGRRLGRAIGIPLGAGVLFCWAFVFLVLPAIHLGLSEHAARRIPLVGLAIGLFIGWGAQRFESLRKALGYAAFPLILGALFWGAAVLLGGGLILVGVPDDWLPLSAFAAGVLLGAGLLLRALYDWVEEHHVR
jgi:hypothetical protein